jgi:capsid protein
MPILGVILEKLSKMDRYSDAVLGSAEERAKIVMFIQHHLNASGDNPFMQNIVKAVDPTAQNVPVTDDGKVLADNIAATTQKAVFNMPQGSELKTVNSENDLYFKDFITVNIHLVCAAIGMPYNIAMSKYDDNYSSSRAAIKDWENTLNVTREYFGRAFYRPIYKFYLEIMVMEGKISAPGYINARQTNNRFILNAYRKARFVGTPVPHIDPVKEVNAERAKLGPLGAHLPLTTLEAATENLNGGESQSNIEQFSQEIKNAENLNIKMPVKETTSGKEKEED